MDLKQTLEYQQTAQSYLQDNQVYDLFEYLLRQVLIDRPENPLDYLISKLENPRRRRLVITGGNGPKRRQISSQIASRFKVQKISVIDLLKDEVKRAGQWASKIQQTWQSGTNISDQIVLDLLMPAIQQTEKQDKSYLLQGCPRTRVQSLALQRAGVIPDRVVILEPDLDQYKQSFKTHYVQVMQPEDPNTFINSHQTEQAASTAVQEYKYNIRGVKDVYKAQHHQIDGKPETELIIEEVARIFMMKGRSRGPRKPPRVIVLGPPGSGRSTQAQELSKRYGLTFVSTSQLLRDQINRKTEIGKSVGGLIQAGELVPDHIITQVVRNRLLETDCKLNGWVLDGFPKTLQQSRALKEFKIIPTHVFFLEGSDNLVYERLENRCLDPNTGIYYSKASLPEDGDVVGRLISLPEDGHDAVRKRLMNYKEHATKLHAEFARYAANIKADIEAVLITEMMGDAIENSIPHDFD